MRLRKQRGAGAIPDEVREEARRNAGGYVYEIVGDYGPEDDVPPEAIRGAWKVDDAGNVTNEYERNPNFVEPSARVPN
jgi:hypothetical protein